MTSTTGNDSSTGTESRITVARVATTKTRTNVDTMHKNLDDQKQLFDWWDVFKVGTTYRQQTTDLLFK